MQCVKLGQFLMDSAYRVARLHRLYSYLVDKHELHGGATAFIRCIDAYTEIMLQQFDMELRKIYLPLPTDTESFQIPNDDIVLFRIQYLVVREFVDQLDRIIEGLTTLNADCIRDDLESES